MGSKSNDHSPPVAERRPKQRRRVLLTGIVAYNEGVSSFDCTIRSLSETGAQIGIGKNLNIPSDFFLINVRDRIAYDARQVWSKGGYIGVTFRKVLPLSGITDPALGFLGRLWMAKATR